MNFSGGNAFITFETVVWALIAGLFLGCIVSLYSKVYLGKVVRTLLKKGAVGEENAVPFWELGMRDNYILRRALKDNSPLRKHVSISNGAECALPDNQSGFIKKVRKFFSGSEKKDTVYDLSASRLYIPSEKKYAADVKYYSKGNPLFLLPAALILFALLAAAAYFGMPKLLEMFDSLITSFKNI